MVYLPGQAIFTEPVAFPKRPRSFRENLHTIDVRDSGRSSFWPLIPELPCVRMSCSFLQKDGNVGLDRVKVFRMSIEFGGTQG